MVSFLQQLRRILIMGMLFMQMNCNANGDLKDVLYLNEQIDSAILEEGVSYQRYSLKNSLSNAHVLTIDLSKKKIQLETVMADEICPNPNHNDNDNNGKCIREVLSETCLRRIKEGRMIVAGVNTGFFNSHLGFPRGIHVEYGEPLFVNNPYVREHFPYHLNGFTFFADRTCSFEESSFCGFVKSRLGVLEFYSVNDTILMDNGTHVGYEYSSQSNIYTSRFKIVPHPEYPEIVNTINPKALFVVVRSEKNLAVNCGYIKGKVIRIVDGRKDAAVVPPVVEQRNEWVLRLTGKEAERMESLSVGDELQIETNVQIGNQKKPIIMHNASMHHFLKNGMLHDSKSKIKPSTVIGIDKQGTCIKIVCVDGVTSNGSGMNYEQLYHLMCELGMYNAVRMDGGGSTSMWINRGSDEGELVCKSCDSKGKERSCMNYLHVRILE